MTKLFVSANLLLILALVSLKYVSKLLFVVANWDTTVSLTELILLFAEVNLLVKLSASAENLLEILSH